MGIRFFCPNGHRLHVKTFLAGKRGICPDCGMGVDIPHTSNPAALRRSKEVDLNAPTLGGMPDEDPELPLPPSMRPGGGLPSGIGSASIPLPAPAFANMPASVVAAAPAKTSAMLSAPATGAIPRGQAIGGSGNLATSAIPMGTLPASSATALAAPPPMKQESVSLIDPIAEAPQAVWYVRPSSGGQYGPARGDMMRGWLGEGRVSADSLVWREGWTDWQPAEKVFPMLGGNGDSSLTTLGDDGGARRNLLRRRSSSMGTMIVVLLLFVAITLGIALVVVLNNSGSSSTPAPASKSPATPAVSPPAPAAAK